MSIPLHIEYYSIFRMVIFSLTLLGVIMFTFIQRKMIRLPALLLTLMALHLVTIQIICNPRTIHVPHAIKAKV